MMNEFMVSVEGPEAKNMEDGKACKGVARCRLRDEHCALVLCVFGISVPICANLVVEVVQFFYRGTVSQPFKACDCHTCSDLF